MILQYEKAQAILYSSFMSNSNMTASISGTLGRITLGYKWNESETYSLITNENIAQFDLPIIGYGFTYEIDECHKCIDNNQIESNLWSHANMLDLIEIVDHVRVQTGLVYPADAT